MKRAILLIGVFLFIGLILNVALALVFTLKHAAGSARLVAGVTRPYVEPQRVPRDLRPDDDFGRYGWEPMPETSARRHILVEEIQRSLGYRVALIDEFPDLTAPRPSSDGTGRRLPKPVKRTMMAGFPMYSLSGTEWFDYRDWERWQTPGIERFGILTIDNFDGDWKYLPQRKIALPTEPMLLGTVVNSVLCAAILWLMTLGPLVMRRAWRRSRWRCERCAYELFGHASTHQCSQCGRMAAAPGRTGTQGTTDRRRRPFLIAGGFLAIGCALNFLIAVGVSLKHVHALAEVSAGSTFLSGFVYGYVNPDEYPELKQFGWTPAVDTRVLLFAESSFANERYRYFEVAGPDPTESTGLFTPVKQVARAGFPFHTLIGHEWIEVQTGDCTAGFLNAPSAFSTIWRIDNRSAQHALLRQDLIEIPTRPIILGSLANTIFYALIVWGITTVSYLIFLTWRRPLWKCGHCAHDLRGHGRKRCPECGTAARGAGTPDRGGGADGRVEVA